MSSPDLLLRKKLWLADGLVVDIPERPYLVRPGAKDFALLRPLDEQFQFVDDDPFLVIGIESEGNLYWHSTSRAEWDAAAAIPGALQSPRVVTRHFPWNTFRNKGPSTGGPTLVYIQIPIFLHHFYQTIEEPGAQSGFSDPMEATLIVRIVRPEEDYDPDADPPEPVYEDVLTVDLTPIDSPPRRVTRIRRTKPVAVAPLQMRQNKTVLNAIGILRAGSLRLDNNVVVGLPESTLSFYQPRYDRHAVLYAQMLDDAFRPIARTADGGRKIMVLCVRSHSLVHYEWMEDGVWEEIYNDPRSVRDGTIVVLMHSEKTFESFPLRVVTPLANDMHAVVALPLQVRLDLCTHEPMAGAVGTFYESPATLYFPAALELERDVAARYRRKSRRAPLNHTRVLLTATRPVGPYQLGDLGVVLPVLRGSDRRTFDEWLSHVQDALTPAKVGAVAKLARLAVAFKNGDEHVFVFDNGRRFEVSPFVFHATIAIAQTPMVRLGNVWIERRLAADMRRGDGEMTFPDPIGAVPSSAAPIKRMRTGAPADRSPIDAWETVLRGAVAARVGDLEPLLTILAVGAALQDGTHLLVALDGERHAVPPAVFHTIFMFPAESVDPFVETTVAWIKDSLRGTMETESGEILRFPAPIGNIHTQNWSKKRMRE